MVLFEVNKFKIKHHKWIDNGYGQWIDKTEDGDITFTINKN